MRFFLRVGATYIVFGIAHELVAIAYCMYRARMGNPSDLPCVSLLWTTMGIVGWPIDADMEAATGLAVLVPSLLVRGIGVAFLMGFLVAMAWLIRSRRRT